MKKLALLPALALTFFCSPAQAQWTVQNSGFTNPDMEVFSISAPSSTVVWAAAYDSTFNVIGGYYTKTINGGTTWSPSMITNSNGFLLSCIYGMDQNNAWVTMNDVTNGGGGIYHTTDGGTTWNQQTPSAFSGSYGYGDLIYFFDANNGLAVGDSNGGYWEIYTTANAGANWTRVAQLNIPANLPNEYGQDGVFAVNGNTLWFVTNKGRVYKTINKGLNWTVTQTGMADVLMIAFKDANNGLASDASGNVLQKSINGGSTWTNVAFNGLLFDYGLAATNGFYVSAGYGGSSYSADDGLNWSTIDTLDHTVVQFVSSNVGWSGGWNASSTVGGMFKWAGALGVNEFIGNENVKVYPNPMEDLSFISLQEDPRNAELILTDISGKVVQRIENISYRSIAIHREDLSAGLYLFSITDEKGLVGNGKLIVR